MFVTDCKRGTAYNQVADKNLEDLGPQAGSVLESLLQAPNEEMTQGRADKGTISGHLGHTRSEVVAVLVTVLGQPRGNKLLGASESTSREHLGSQRVLL